MSHSQQTHRELPDGDSVVSFGIQNLAIGDAAESAVSSWDFGKIAWVGRERDKVSMRYLKGDDPWEFFLKYSKDPRPKMEEDIKEKHAQGLLKPVSPKPGDFVVCRHTLQGVSRYFRGIVLKVNDRTKPNVRCVQIYKVDTVEKIVLFRSDIFEIPESIAAIPVCAVKCRMVDGEHRLKERFCKELRLAFKIAIENAIFTVDLGEPSVPPPDTPVLNALPPSYFVVAWGFDESKYVVDVNLSYWIRQWIIPRLREVPEACEDVYSYFLEPEMVDPYYAAALAKVDRYKRYDEDSSSFQEEEDPSKPLEEPNHIEPEVPSSAPEVLPHCSAIEVPTAANGELGPGQGSLSGRSNHGNDHNQTGGQSSSDMSAPKSTPPEFAPHCSIQVTRGNNDDFDGVVADLREEYQPKDEKRICVFYQKHGFCGFKLCMKEHVEKSKAWTTDQIETYKCTFNEIAVPPMHFQVLLKIHHIKNSVSFYATLPDSYSDIGEVGCLETSKTLHADLNAFQTDSPHPLLPCDPCISEVVVTLGHQEALGPQRKWLRARVVEVIDETHVLVFFLDFGNEEIVKTRDLRAIRPQFLHLPPQAVLARLYNLVPNKELEAAALKFLQDTIQGKEMNAFVISQYDDELDVTIYLENGECLNELLARQNFAHPIKTYA